MRKLLFFAVGLALFFAGGFGLARWRSLLQEEPALQEIFNEGPFYPTLYPLQNRSFTFVVIGKNNGATVEKTLRSLFTQNYENYRIVYIDDASNDGSYELARDLIYTAGHLMKATLVRNEATLGFLPNLVRAVQNCSDEEIVAVIQGEDWLAHEWVLQRLNQYYADPDLWLTYGQYREFPSFQLGLCHSIQEKEIRESPSSHFKTFYAGLLKKVGKADLASLLPLLELAQGHSQFIPDILYIANRQKLE